MTIKPVVTPSQKRSGTSSSEADKKESHQVSNVGDAGPNALSQHRNVSPQRRVDVYDDLARHRRSPHKTSRNKRRDHHNDPSQLHHKRERVAAALNDKHGNVALGVSNMKCSSPHSSTATSAVTGVSNASGSVAHASGMGNKSPDHLLKTSQSPQTQTGSVTQAASGLLKAIEDTFSGYNSGDEHLQPKEGLITADEWQKKDEQFAKCMADRGYILKPVEEDGACLFRSISLQIYGDEEMHDVIRQHTMDYIYKNREYFSHFVTEDINSYIKRKRRKDSHGNHIEIQAMSEIYSRPVEVYCYKPTPINIFNSEQSNNGYAPLRLSYQRGSHYNAIIDPYNATVGVGLGLAGYKPELQTKEAVRLSEQLEIEQTMFEDKLKTTDWEATNEAIEEQIARESYLQWCRDNLHKSRNATSTSAAASTSATVTSGEAASDAEASPSKYAIQHLNSTNNMNLMNNKNSSSNSTVTSSASSSSTTTNSNSNNSNSTNLNSLEQHKYNTLSPKHFSSLSHVKNTEDIGFESDDTDMSSTSSIGGSKVCDGAASPSAAGRSKKSKSRTVSNTKKLNKKRRRDLQNSQLDDTVTLRKSPKIDYSCELSGSADKRPCTPDFEQQEPCTSKQSHTPEKQQNLSTADSAALPSSSTASGKQMTKITSSSSSSSSSNSSPSSANKQPYSSFYQELLEASYANDGFGQLTESEMLQRAIQMSTHDYIEDQKRKYLYGP
ncbi:deubiquitinating enzyme A isoform 2-T2 [Cochliomyia hominivorax]